MVSKSNMLQSHTQKRKEKKVVCCIDNRLPLTTRSYCMLHPVAPFLVALETQPISSNHSSCVTLQHLPSPEVPQRPQILHWDQFLLDILDLKTNSPPKKEANHLTEISCY